MTKIHVRYVVPAEGNQVAFRLCNIEGKVASITTCTDEGALPRLPDVADEIIALPGCPLRECKGNTRNVMQRTSSSPNALSLSPCVRGSMR